MGSQAQCKERMHLRHFFLRCVCPNFALSCLSSLRPHKLKDVLHFDIVLKYGTYEYMEYSAV
jgi:hypothetical protein